MPPTALPRSGIKAPPQAPGRLSPARYKAPPQAHASTVATEPPVKQPRPDPTGLQNKANRGRQESLSLARRRSPSRHQRTFCQGRPNSTADRQLQRGATPRTNPGRNHPSPGNHPRQTSVTRSQQPCTDKCSATTETPQHPRRTQRQQGTQHKESARNLKSHQNQQLQRAPSKQRTKHGKGYEPRCNISMRTPLWEPSKSNNQAWSHSSSATANPSTSSRDHRQRIPHSSPRRRRPQQKNKQ